MMILNASDTQILVPILQAECDVPARRFRVLLPIAEAALALLIGAVPCFAQDTSVPPVLLAFDSAQLPPAAPASASRENVPVKPVATDHQMRHKYIWSTLGLDGAISATLSSGLDQWKKSPPEWGSDGGGYARRWVSEYAESAIGDAAKYAVAHYFEQDPSYAPCQCTGFGRRLHHAIDSPFMARKPDGHRVPSVASLAGFVTGHVVSAATWYPAPLGTRDGLKHAGWSLLSKIGMDVFKEFRPRRSPRPSP